MHQLSYQYRIYIAAAIFAVFAVVVVVFGYGFFDSRNEALAEQAAVTKQAYENAQAEQKSYEQGKRDLATLEKKDLKPLELFSQDVTVVDKIADLEAKAKAEQISFTLQVSGTRSDAAPLPGTISSLLIVPYTMNVAGSYEQVLRFLERVEHVNFATSVKGITISAQKGNQVRALITAEFYIQK
jgi:Tfp pilus assembly protein PilO